MIRQFLMMTIVVAVLVSVVGCSGQPTPQPTAQPTSPPAAQPAVQPTVPPTIPPTVPPTSTPKPTATPKKDTPVVIVIPDEPPSFNPAVSDIGYDSMIMEMVMLGMTKIDPQGKVFPVLAAELPTVENGGVVVDDKAGTMKVTWKMRNDVQWADGKPVTADDVIFTWKAMTDPETGAWLPGIDYVEKVDKSGDYGFVVSYNTIYPNYLMQFGGEKVVIWPQHYCDAKQGFVSWDCGRKPLSSGPYVLKEWQGGDHLTFVRNPNYFEKGKPSIEQIIVRIVPEASVRKTMLVKGDADVYMWVTEPVANDLKNEPSVKVNISPTNRWVMRLFFNLAAKGTLDPVAKPHPVLSDVRVRRAIRMAIDVDTLSQKVFYGYGVPVWNEFFRPPYACDIPRPAYDPAAAAALLQEAGWVDTNGDGVRECDTCKTAKKGYPMKMEMITYAEYGEPIKLIQQLIAESLKKIGMDFKLTVVEGSVLWADYASGGIEQRGNFDMDLWDDGYAGVDPTDFLRELYHSDSAKPDQGSNYGRFKDKAFDELLDSAYTLDEKQRQETFCQMAKVLEEKLPNIMLFSTLNAEAHSVRVEGIQSTVNDVVTWNVADWRLK